MDTRKRTLDNYPLTTKEAFYEELDKIMKQIQSQASSQGIKITTAEVEIIALTLIKARNEAMEKYKWN